MKEVTTNPNQARVRKMTVRGENAWKEPPMYLPRVSKMLKITMGIKEFQVCLSSLSRFLRKAKVGTLVTPGKMMKVMKKTMKTCVAWLKTFL